MSSGLEAAILDYVNHLHDDAFFDRLLECAAPIKIARAVVELTASDDRTSVSYATMFAEDGCRHLRHLRFRRRLVATGFLDALRANLNSDNYFIRRDAVVVIGRTFSDLLSDVAAIVPHSIECDPLLLDTLLREVCRISDERWDSHWDAVHSMVASSSYLARWAAIEVVTWNQLFRPDQSEAAIPPAKTILRTLAADSHPHIRVEARYRLRELEAHEEGGALRLNARRRLYRTIAADEPDITFGGVKQQFENYCWWENVADYELAQLDAWVSYREQHPLSYDDLRDLNVLPSYYRRFTESFRPRSSRE